MNNTKDVNENINLSLFEIVSLIKKNLISIIAAAIFGGLVGYYYFYLSSSNYTSIQRVMYDLNSIQSLVKGLPEIVDFDFEDNNIVYGSDGRNINPNISGRVNELENINSFLAKIISDKKNVIEFIKSENLDLSDDQINLLAKKFSVDINFDNVVKTAIIIYSDYYPGREDFSFKYALYIKKVILEELNNKLQKILLLMNQHNEDLVENLAYNNKINLQQQSIDLIEKKDEIETSIDIAKELNMVMPVEDLPPQIGTYSFLYGYKVLENQLKSINRKLEHLEDSLNDSSTYNSPNIRKLKLKINKSNRDGENIIMQLQNSADSLIGVNMADMTIKKDGSRNIYPILFAVLFSFVLIIFLMISKLYSKLSK
tara:strand:- start:464 stop:1573 length:1110 start_codon:yes stop_codon:yes gene_type:complete